MNLKTTRNTLMIRRFRCGVITLVRVIRQLVAAVTNFSSTRVKVSTRVKQVESFLSSKLFVHNYIKATTLICFCSSTMIFNMNYLYPLITRKTEYDNLKDTMLNL